MNKSIILSRIKEFNEDRNRNFPDENLGIGDRYLLSITVREKIIDWENLDTGKNIRTAGFISSVLDDMKK